jgi:hypothetical protein
VDLLMTVNVHRTRSGVRGFDPQAVQIRWRTS